MDRAIYTCMTGAKHSAMALAVHANNLAHVGSDAFRRDYVAARSIGARYGDAHPTRVHVLAERPVTDFTAGALRATGRALDVAVQGEGWIAVRAEDGAEAYTRSGSLQITPSGQLLTAGGLPVLGKGGPIAIPDPRQATIGEDGTVTVHIPGEGAGLLAEIDRIRLVNPPAQQLEKRADGLFGLQGGTRPPADASVLLAPGFVERSNVDAVDELIGLLGSARQLALQLRMMKAVDDNAAAAARLLRIA